MRLQLIRAALVIGVLAGCGDDGGSEPHDAAVGQDAELDAALDAPPDAPRVCDSEDRDDDYVAGMVKVGLNGYRVVLTSSTPPIGPRGTYAWSIQVQDSTPTPRDGLHLTVFPFMPDHGHGSTAVTIIPGGSNGMYQLNDLSLFMTGYWTIRIALRESSGMPELDAITYRFCVD